MKVIKWLDAHFEEFFLVVLLALISIFELAQVIVRNIPWIPALTWAEELCRFLWIASVFISLPFTIRKSSMLRVNVLMDLLPQTAKKIVNMLVDLIDAGAMGLLAYYAVDLLKKRMKRPELSPALQFPIWIMYLMMLVCFILGALRAIQMFIIHAKNFRERELTATEKTMKEAAEEAAAGQKAEQMKGGNE